MTGGGKWRLSAATIAGVLLVAFALIAIFAPLVAPVDPNRQDLFARLKPPGTELRETYYLFGTDELGRDILSRIIFGSRVSLLVAITSVFVSLIIGTSLGVMAGYFRGWVEAIIMRVADVVLSVPALLLAIITTLGDGELSNSSVALLCSRLVIKRSWS